MASVAEKFVNDCFDELCISEQYVPYIEKAKAAGLPQLAKMFRALVESEKSREALMRKGLVHHADLDCDYYVCPQCGLVYDLEQPERCVVDEMPGEKFIVIK